MADRPVFVYVAAYDNADDAKSDYEAVKELHKAGLVGTYDSALITKDAEGKVHLTKTEKPTQHGLEAGAVAGAIVGLFFPPILLAEVAVGAAAGGILEHVRKGLPSKDLKELGETLDSGSAAVIVIGESKVEEAVNKAVTKATKVVEKQVTDDAKQFNKDLEAAVKASEK
jgi:uncharacterized membrane protein